jgi:hypothetical protein
MESVMWMIINMLYREYCRARLQEMRRLTLSHGSTIWREQSVAAGICGLAVNRNQESSYRTVIEGESYAAIDRRSADTPN